MTVKQLRDALLDISDEMAVVVPTSDHGYRVVYAINRDSTCVSGREYIGSCGGKCEECEGKQIVLVLR